MTMPSASNEASGSNALRVLFFEDDAEDIDLCLRALTSAGLHVAADVAASLAKFREFVAGRDYDVVLSDYRMPGATAMDAFAIMRQAGIQTPFILVTGMLGDERAVECLKEGVADYVLKDRLARLPFAVRRALEEDRLRRGREEAGEKLRRSEASYRSLIQSAPCGILRMDAGSGQLLEANPAVARMLGYESASELLPGQTQASPALSVETAAELLKRCNSGDCVEDVEVVWSHQSGAPLMVRLAGRLLRAPDGHPLCFEMTAENITERRIAEKRILQLNRLYAVLSQVGQAVVQYRERASFFREICNILVEVGRLSLACIVMREAETGQLKTAACSCRCQERPENLEDAIRAMVATAVSRGRKEIVNEVPGVGLSRAAGNACGCRSAGAFPIFLHGEACGAIAIRAVEDDYFDPENTALFEKLAANASFALESMAAEELRRRAMNEVDQIFVLARDLLCIFDLEGRILRANPAWEETLGFTLAEVQARRLVDLVYPDDRARVLAALADLRSGIAVETLEVRFVSKAGLFRWLVGSTVLLDRGAAYAALSDITQRKDLEERLKRQNLELERQSRRTEAANRTKSQFLANMSHELRSPLNGIIGFAELLYDGRAGHIEPRQSDLLGRIHKSAKHLLQLINGILDLSKVESGRLEIHYERVWLPNIVQEVTGVLATLAAEKLIEVSIAIDGEVRGVIADPDRFKQVLYNYLSNALKFTPEGGKVAVRIRPEASNQFRLEVSDDGQGIAEKDLPLLFRDFQQLDSTASKQHAGTGLGLALTKRIVEVLGGSVGVRSRPGEGSTFFALLPRDPNGAGAKRSVLIVEDESVEQFVLSRILGEAGYAVDTARTAEEAVSKCQEKRYDAITMDVVLPDGCGLETIARIRTIGGFQDTPVIIVSSVDGECVSTAGAQGFLTKPVDGHDLLKLLSGAGMGAGVDSIGV